jgi:hypothetical protein
MGVVAADLAESRNLRATLVSTDLEKSARGNEEITETVPRVVREIFSEFGPLPVFLSV